MLPSYQFNIHVTLTEHSWVNNALPIQYTYICGSSAEC